jgi:hypothetical protein
MARLKIYFAGIFIGHFLIRPQPRSASIDIGVCVDVWMMWMMNGIFSKHHQKSDYL